ncbi:hypothetical protein JTB14_006582 [Gonioctena quinquepunctata]|nr:hypothetical protein JTB14_006582 [Gonioctena quinquepunctata]
MEPETIAVVLQWLNEQQQDFFESVLMCLNFMWDSDHYLSLILPIREQHQRTPLWEEEWLPNYINYDFFSIFRMSRDSFTILFQNIDCEELHKEFVGGNYPISAEKTLLMTLWWLGKGEVLLSVADRFNISLSAVHKGTELVLHLILNLLEKYIVWPNEEELTSIEVGFQDRAGFPGVIGAIDCCNIKFKAPAEHQDSYTDRKMQHSIKLQGIVISHKIFTNIMVGFPGSAHDSRVLNNSGIFIDIEQNGQYRKYFPLDDYHIVGDSAYPLKKWLMKPYTWNGALNDSKRRFNNALSRTRIVVEHTFGLLKSRWRILGYVNVNSVEKAVKIITACCILHNFCYINNDLWNEPLPPLEVEDDFNNAVDINMDGITKGMI